MVRAAQRRDEPIAELARRYDINQNQLSRWMREYSEGAPWSRVKSVGLLPVSIVSEAEPSASLALEETGQDSCRDTHAPSLRATLALKSGHRLELEGLDVEHFKVLVQVLT